MSSDLSPKWAPLLDGRLNHADNVLEALPSWRQGGAVASQAELYPLDHVGSPGFLRLGRLSPDRHSKKKSAKPWKAESARSVASTPLKSST